MNIWKERINVFMQYKGLLEQLVIRDVKLKYRRSVLGYVWSILNPLLIMIIMTMVFSNIFERQIENYPVYLITGRTLFEFTTSSTNAAMRSIIGNSSLLKKCYVPKYIFTLAKITSSLVDLIFSMGALVLVIVVTGSPITYYVLFTPLVLIQLYLFCCGLGFFLATMNVFFRDVQYIYKAFTTGWMYLTPLFYSLETLDNNKLQFFVKAFNPLYYYIAQFRDLVYKGQFPGYRIFWGGWLIAIVTFAVGVTIFKKKQDKFILYI